VGFGLQFDSIVTSMLILVTGVSFLVHIYSTSYMGEDPHLPRFMSYLSLFTFFMIVLVTSPSLPQLFIGWEGVGLCSYLLIGF
jgi:NADH:ubiquinone oxidoreductase subunit 5 (subunit L)/multisubunit Na+/H+ antiporter MnhA subunit